MSRCAFDASKNAADVYDFDTLLFAAMRRADPIDLDRLREAFPQRHNEFSAYRCQEPHHSTVKP